MKSFNRLLLLVSLLAAALLCYLYGFSKGAILLIALGVTLELAFWIGVFSPRKDTG